MARPVAFPEANLIYWPPAGAEDDVVPLYVRQGNYAVISCWNLASDELDEILRTGVVWTSLPYLGRPPFLMVSGRRAHVL